MAEKTRERLSVQSTEKFVPREDVFERGEISRRYSFETERGGKFHHEKAESLCSQGVGRIDHQMQSLPLVEQESKSTLPSSQDQPLLNARACAEYDTFPSKQQEQLLNEACEQQTVICDASHLGDAAEHCSSHSFLAKTNSDEPRELALDMFLSSIDISFFTLPLVFQGMGVFFGTGLFFNLLVLSLMASQCYIELKRFSTIARGSDRDYVGLIDLIEECCGPNSNGIHNSYTMRITELYLKFVTVSTLVMLLASNQAFVTVVLQQVVTNSLHGATAHLQNYYLSSYVSLVPIFIFVWVFVSMVKHARASSLNLLTMTVAFIMLAFCSLCFSSLTNQQIYLPSILPEKISNLDQTFGFLTSYFVLPLLIIAEDRKDYSVPGTSSPDNSAQSYSLFVKYSGAFRFCFGLAICLTVQASSANFIKIDPFQMMLVCIFTLSSVSAKMVAYLYKFTSSHFISVFLPCLISVLQVVTSSDIGLVNTVANYVATFFAYQFLVIIPFALFYLRCTQLTASEEHIISELQHDDPETSFSPQADVSMTVNANEETRLLQAEMQNNDESNEAAAASVTNQQRVLEASRRIYIFDWISDVFIGNSVRKANIFALSFVVSGFKTLLIMLLLVFWSVTWVILSGMFSFVAQFF